MKQLLFLLLFPCFAMAQYQGNGNQKITLGEQTTADGLVYRGVENDTALITPFSDTSAYIILDTINNKFYNYNRSTNVWSLAGGGGGGGGTGTVTSITAGTGLTGGTITTNGTLAADTNFLVTRFDTASMLTNYYRAGRNGIIQAADVPTLNQNTTGSAATLTTGRTIQTNLASTSAATFNGSVNITPGITGTLGGANGGTGLTTFGAVGNIPYASSTTALKTHSRFKITEVGAAPYLDIDGAIRLQNASSFAFYNQNSDYGFSFQTPANTRTWVLQTTVGGFDVFCARGPEKRFGINYAFQDSLQISETLTVKGNAKITAVGALGGNSATLYRNSDGVLSTTSSDINKKHNVRPIIYGLSTINQLNPVNFQWNVDESEDIGFIAQDIQNIIPESIETDWDSNLIFKYEKLIPILTKAIQEQTIIIKQLEQRILNLENK